MEHLIDAAGAAEVLGLSGQQRVLRMARAAELPSVRIGRFVRFRPEDLRDWVEQHRSPANPSAGGSER
jgi:excisionase family DNA binding protein